MYMCYEIFFMSEPTKVKNECCDSDSHRGGEPRDRHSVSVRPGENSGAVRRFFVPSPEPKAEIR
jgi:hypothetical protein